MTAQKHIYRVSFKEPIDGKTDYFFGGLSAIFTTFAPEQVGCKVTRLWNVKITEDKPYIGKKCTITKESLTRKNKNA
ncbi:MAG: hypothetical protein FWF53_03340 [Candidatus Azobacteroides sp.]|nr:hypothetical protein [Candidatus Azobacteroides sp.]